jgi:hypothetical protein
MRVPRARIGGREALADSLGEREVLRPDPPARNISRHESTSTPDFDFDFDLAIDFACAIDLAFGLANDCDFGLAIAIAFALGLRGPSGRWGRIAADSVQMCAAARRRAS